MHGIIYGRNIYADSIPKLKRQASRIANQKRHTYGKSILTINTIAVNAFIYLVTFLFMKFLLFLDTLMGNPSAPHK